MNINWNIIKKVAAGIAVGGIIGMILDCIRAKTRYYKKASKLMDKTNEYMDKTMKLVEDQLD